MGERTLFRPFCELILPYRISTEPLENWREKALASFADLYRSFLENDTLSPVEACVQLNRLLPRFRVDRDFPVMNFSQLMASSRGNCDAMGSLAIFAMRALGIPVAKEFTVQWPHKLSAGGHSWNSVYDGQGGYVSFMGTEADPGEPHQGLGPKYKVFRQTFGRQINLPLDRKHISPRLQDKYFIDVSSEYPDCPDIVVPQRFSPSEPTGYAYLAILTQNGWEPIA
ncbi:MAG: transglutaminase-like domain-containing protein [Rikenellaceae bacterium]|nr:transglutaminase-like domain-containing protein [Rikenellaceae bacterium]